MERPRVVISETIHPDALERLAGAASVEHDPTLWGDPTRLRVALEGADALVVRNRTSVDGALLEAAPSLRVVGRLGVGLDNLDLGALRARRVRVVWAPGANAASVAEYVMGAALAVTRRFESVSAELHAGRWDRQAAVGGELLGRTLGIVGLGDIGARLARRARAFGMRLLAADPVQHESSFAVQEYGVALVPLERLLGEADIVSLHAPLLPSTRHLIDRRALALMKPGAILINTARGGLIDEAALAEALRSGRLGGAVLDVREHEPPGEGDPLRGLATVLLSPHVAGVTEPADRRVSLHVAADVLRVLAGEPPLSEVPA